MARARREQRQQRADARRRSSRVRVLAIAAALIAVLVGCGGLYRSQLFAVKHIEVVGNVFLKPDEVRSIAAVPDDSTLLRFSGGAIKRRLLASAWIGEATITRDFPDTLRIRITEREPAALIDLGGATFWLVDAHGMMLAQRTPDASSTLVVIRDVQGLDPKVGRASTSDSLDNALRVLAGISTELRSQVRILSAPSIDKTALLTVKDVEIVIGSADDIEKKDLVVRQILKEQGDKVVYINVRTVDRPTVRGLPSEP